MITLLLHYRHVTILLITNYCLHLFRFYLANIQTNLHLVFGPMMLQKQTQLASKIAPKMDEKMCLITNYCLHLFIIFFIEKLVN